MSLIAEAARHEAILLDTAYTGKAFYGMAQEIRKGVSKRERASFFCIRAACMACSRMPILLNLNTFRQGENEPTIKN